VELSRGRRTQRGECGGLPDRRDGSGPCDARRGTAAVFIAGAVATGLAVLGTAFATDFGLLLVLRLLPGIAGALAFLAGGVLDTQVASGLGGRAPVGIGVFYTGPGVGIFLAGAIVPPLLREEAATWPSAWIGLGVACLVCSGIAALAARRTRGAESRGDQTTGSGTVLLTPAMVS